VRSSHEEDREGGREGGVSVWFDHAHVRRFSCFVDGLAGHLREGGKEGGREGGREG